MNKKNCFLFLITYISLLFSGCITYRNFPVNKLGKSKKPASYSSSGSDLLFYNIEGHTLFSGEKTLKKIFSKKSPFLKTEKRESIPSKGLFVKVIIEKNPPHMLSAVFGYACYASLGFSPFWSKEDGYNLRYIFYRNGERQKTFEYNIQRNSFFWVLMLPVAWINLFTYSEGDAFEATTYQFFEDADYLLHN